MDRWHVDEQSIYDENGQQIIEASEWYMGDDLQKICDEHNMNTGVIEVLKKQNDRYFKALLNLSDYVLTGEHKEETLKLLGLWDEENV
jgi:hypothetical protein